MKAYLGLKFPGIVRRAVRKAMGKTSRPAPQKVEPPVCNPIVERQREAARVQAVMALGGRLGVPTDAAELVKLGYAIDGARIELTRRAGIRKAVAEAREMNPAIGMEWNVRRFIDSGATVAEVRAELQGMVADAPAIGTYRDWIKGNYPPDVAASLLADMDSEDSAA